MVITFMNKILNNMTILPVMTDHINCFSLIICRFFTLLFLAVGRDYTLEITFNNNILNNMTILPLTNNHIKCFSLVIYWIEFHQIKSMVIITPLNIII